MEWHCRLLPGLLALKARASTHALSLIKESTTKERLEKNVCPSGKPVMIHDDFSAHLELCGKHSRVLQSKGRASNYCSTAAQQTNQYQQHCCYYVSRRHLCQGKKNNWLQRAIWRTLLPNLCWLCLAELAHDVCRKKPWMSLPEWHTEETMHIFLFWWPRVFLWFSEPLWMGLVAWKITIKMLLVTKFFNAKH